MLSAETSSVFVGRTSELDDLDRWFKQGQGRLLTLLGPPGVGKTSLMRRWREAHAPQVIWVELLPLMEASQCLGAISEALGVQLQGLATEAQHLEQLSAILEARGPLVLALDNMEHLIEARELLAQLLEQVETLRVIVTSRRALELVQERRYELEPLGQLEARELYLSRLSRALTQDDAASLDALLSRLDGLPLALELAAAQHHFFTISELGRALDDALGVLELDYGQEHHRSLERALWSSWQLLKPQERSLLSALSLWPGSFTIEQAQVLSGLESAALWRSLKALRSHSMVSRNGDKMQLLWSVRQFVLQSADRELLEQARQRLHQWLERRGQELFEWFNAPRMDEACEQIRALMPVLFAELAQPTMGRARRLLFVVLLGLLFERGYLSSGQIEPLYTSVLDYTQDSPRLYVQLLFQNAARAKRSGDEARAFELLERAEAIAAEHGLEVLLGQTYRYRGFLNVIQRRFREGDALFDKALEIAEATKDQDLLGMTMFYKAWVLRVSGQPTQALSWARRCVFVFQEHAAPTRLALARVELGVLLANGALWQEAREQLTLARQVLNTSTFVISMGTLEGAWAQYFVARGELMLAYEAADRAIEVFRQCGYLRMVVTWQIYKVGWLVQEARWSDAAASLLVMLRSAHHISTQLTQESLQALLAMCLWALGDRAQVRGYLEILRDRISSCGPLIQHLLAHVAKELDFEVWPTPAETQDEIASLALASWRAAPAERAALVEALERAVALANDKVYERVVLGLLSVGDGGHEAAQLVKPSALSEATPVMLSWSGDEIMTLELSGGEQVSLKRRAPMRRILSALVRLAQRDANAELSVWEVFEAGWPGEQVEPDVASHRVYVTMNRLRGLGLEAYVLTTGDGYRWVVDDSP